jgi:hypothetical protein
VDDPHGIIRVCVFAEVFEVGEVRELIGKGSGRRRRILCSVIASRKEVASKAKND